MFRHIGIIPTPRGEKLRRVNSLALCPQLVQFTQCLQRAIPMIRELPKLLRRLLTDWLQLTIGHTLQGMMAVYNQADYEAERIECAETVERVILEIIGASA